MRQALTRIAVGPEFLAIYPDTILSLLYSLLFLSTWRWKVQNKVTLLHAVDNACNDVTGDLEYQNQLREADPFTI